MIVALRDASWTHRSRACTNPLGVKGVGELGTIGATPAVVNAVVDALDARRPRPRRRALQMPLTSERVWRALDDRRV